MSLVKTLPQADAAFLVNCVTDTTGVYFFNPESLAHTYGYDGSNNMLTDTATDGTLTFKKTYTYTGSNVQTETGWVKQ